MCGKVCRRHELAIDKDEDTNEDADEDEDED